MKKLVLLIAVFATVFSLSACDEVCVGAECITGEVETTGEAENTIPFTHIDGHGKETEKLGYILFEIPTRDYVKYQVAYLSCTCRPAVYNYFQVMYIEVNIGDNAVNYISFDNDGEDGHYHPGTWGDSMEIPRYGDESQGTVPYETMVDDFIPWLVGKTSADFDGISVFTNDTYHDTVTNTTDIAETDLIDAFAGSSVSTNNMIRMVKEVLAYHETKY